MLTDSDRAGFVIRSRIKSCIPGQYLKHAYIPDVYGKERRKKQRAGRANWEWRDAPQVLIQSLRRAGATFLEEGGTCAPSPGLTKADLYAAGLSGRPDSGARRLALLRRLELPEHLTANGLLVVLNACYGAGEAGGDSVFRGPRGGRSGDGRKERKNFSKTLDNSAQFAIITFVRESYKEIAGLCKGSTTDSDSVCEGSNPSPAAKTKMRLVSTSRILFLGVLPADRALLRYFDA